MATAEDIKAAQNRLVQNVLRKDGETDDQLAARLAMMEAANGAGGGAGDGNKKEKAPKPFKNAGEMTSDYLGRTYRGPARSRAR